MNNNDYSDKSVALCFTIKNRVTLKNNNETLRLLGNCLSTLSNNLDNFLFKSLQFHFADFQSTDCNLGEEINKHLKVKSQVHIHSINTEFGRGPGFNRILNNINCKDIDCVGFLDVDMIFVRDLVLQRAFDLTITHNNAYFPICLKLIQDGHTERPVTLTGYGNSFIPGHILHDHKIQFINKYTWGEEDLKLYNNVNRVCKCVRECPPGFYHQWHPTASNKPKHL